MRQTKQACYPAPSVASGGGGGSVTGNESFITVNDDTATLPNSRQLTAGTHITVVDGGAGNPITINALWPVVPSSYLDILWLKADLFQGGEPAGYTPAPCEEIVLPSGNKLRAIKFVAGVETHAICHIPFPDNVPGFPGLYYVSRIYWLTDNADVTHTVDIDVGYRHYASGDNLDTVAAAWAAMPLLSAGVNLLNTRDAAYIYAGPAAGNAILAMCNVRRRVDLMPGTAWLIGVRLSIGLPL